jgi:hypothetical protein
MSKGYRILVCGGRDYADRERLFGILNLYVAQQGRLVVIQGGATGADALAREWCFGQESVWMVNEPADWKRHGKAAGPIRNQLMLDQHKPEIVIAFGGGKGTRDMMRRAREAGVPVVHFAEQRTAA